MVLSDALRGILGLIFVALLYLPDVATTVRLAALFGVAFFGGIVNAVFQPAVAAAIPDLVPISRLAAANSLNQLSVHGAAFIGQAIGGVLLRLLGAPFLFLIDALSFLVSSITELFIRIPRAAIRPTGPLREVLRVYLADTRDGLRFVWARPGMRFFLLAAAGLNLFFMPVFVLLPFYVTDILSRGAEWYGFLLAALSVGSFVGVSAAGALGPRPVVRALVPASLVTAPVAFGILGSITWPGAALLLCFLVGLSVGLVNVVVLTLFQLGSPAGMRARVVAIAISISGAATPLGLGLGGLIGDLTGRNVPLVFAACGALATLVSVAATSHADVRRFVAGSGETALAEDRP